MRLIIAAIGLILFAFLPEPGKIVGQNQDTTIAAISHAHGSTFHIGQQNIVGKAVCSGTAVGPHAILTATHCELQTDELFIDGVEDTVTIENRIRDGNDHTIYVVNAEFPTYSKIKIDDSLAQGEKLFYFGNPGKYTDLYREGYISGSYQEPSLFSINPKFIVMDFNGWFGDSGSGIFNYDGQVVLVVSAVSSDNRDDVALKLVLSFPLAFKQGDLDKIENPSIHIKR